MPETLVVAKPLVHRSQRLGVELANSRGAAAVGNDQPGRAQQAEMLGNCRAAHGKVTREFADGTAGHAQEAQYFAAGGIGEGAKDGLTVSLVALGMTKRFRTGSRPGVIST